VLANLVGVRMVFVLSAGLAIVLAAVGRLFIHASAQAYQQRLRSGGCQLQIQRGHDRCRRHEHAIARNQMGILLCCLRSRDTTRGHFTSAYHDGTTDHDHHDVPG
jgi:hypothetical protein